jgi:hypothetical protein
VAVHIYTQTIQRTTQITNNVGECGPCPVFASFTLAFAFQLRKKARKNLSQGNKNLSQVNKNLSLSNKCAPEDISRYYATLKQWRKLATLSVRMELLT